MKFSETLSTPPKRLPTTLKPMSWPVPADVRQTARAC
jgi:hypothetical protein